MTGADAALLALLDHLAGDGYRFVTPTPATHARIIARPEKSAARDLRDVFGWSLPFARTVLPDALFQLLERAEMITGAEGGFRSLVRVSSLDSLLFLHSAYPTTRSDAVFFGPDSYRFARFVLAELAAATADRLVDVGAGAGVGAIAAMREGRVSEALLTDINPLALRFARINARHAGLRIETALTTGLSDVAPGFPFAIMNPPFIADPARRTYRDGGGRLGGDLSLAWALAAARRVAPGGRVLLYTGSAIVNGTDPLEAALRDALPPDCALRYAELDPDIFGEELTQPAYAGVERIAAIGAIIERRH
ncbi:MAG: methyltransferase [Sphingosinicella sp.]|uniref:methyltransferase n=1 Tax=Sphingosinicella sp. TaxID=1917971 RepID=UPI0040379F42